VVAATLLQQLQHLQNSLQNLPALKQSQYPFKHLLLVQLHDLTAASEL